MAAVFCQSCGGTCISRIGSIYHGRGEKIHKSINKSYRDKECTEWRMQKVMDLQNPHFILYYASVYCRNLLQVAIFYKDFEFIEFIVNYARENLSEEYYQRLINNPGGFNKSYFIYPIQIMNVELIQLLLRLNIPLRGDEIINTIWRGNQYPKGIPDEMISVIKLLLENGVAVTPQNPIHCIGGIKYSEISNCTFLHMVTFALGDVNFGTVLELLMSAGKLIFDSWTEESWQHGYLSCLIGEIHYTLKYKIDDEIIRNNIISIIKAYLGRNYFEKVSEYIMSEFEIVCSEYNREKLSKFIKNLVNSYQFMTCSKQFINNMYSVSGLRHIVKQLKKQKRNSYIIFGINFSISSYQTRIKKRQPIMIPHQVFNMPHLRKYICDYL